MSEKLTQCQLVGIPDRVEPLGKHLPKNWPGCGDNVACLRDRTCAQATRIAYHLRAEQKDGHALVLSSARLCPMIVGERLNAAKCLQEEVKKLLEAKDPVKDKRPYNSAAYKLNTLAGEYDEWGLVDMATKLRKKVEELRKKANPKKAKLIEADL